MDFFPHDPFIFLAMTGLTFFFASLNAVLQESACETNGQVQNIELREGRGYFTGWAMSIGSLPIKGFRIEIGHDIHEVSCDPIKEKKDFSFSIPLSENQLENFSDRLIKVYPLVGEEKGHVIYFIHNPKLLIPSQEESDAVGHGEFLAVGLKVLSALESHGHLKPSDTVLDAGCGLGRIAYPLTYFLNSKATYEGFDIDASFVNKAKQMINPYFRNFHFQHADVFNSLYNPKGKIQPHEFRFPYRSNSFDFVFLTSVFTHMLPEDMRHYFSEIKRVLKPGGSCLMTAFLLNEESKKLLDEGKSSLTFNYPCKECLLSNEAHPEAAVAYDQEIFVKWLADLDLQVKSLKYGCWCGRTDNWVEYQDMVIVEKSLDSDLSLMQRLRQLFLG